MFFFVSPLYVFIGVFVFRSHMVHWIVVAVFNTFTQNAFSGHSTRSHQLLFLFLQLPIISAETTPWSKSKWIELRNKTFRMKSYWGGKLNFPGVGDDTRNWLLGVKKLPTFGKRRSPKQKRLFYGKVWLICVEFSCSWARMRQLCICWYTLRCSPDEQNSWMRDSGGCVLSGIFRWMENGDILPRKQFQLDYL